MSQSDGGSIGKKNLNWGLKDPNGQDDAKFIEVANRIEENVLQLREELLKK